MKIPIFKALLLLISPVSFFLGLTLVSALLVNRRKDLVKILLLINAGLIWFCSAPLVSEALQRSLEGQFEAVSMRDIPDADAIVVLGGGLRRSEKPDTPVDLTDATDRIYYAARLYRMQKAPLIIVSGGMLPWNGDTIPEAVSMGELLEEWQVPASSILMEPESRNTRQNAKLSKKILEERGIKKILLVTSALHMPRAVAVFRMEGITALPCPTDFRAENRDRSIVFDLLPSAEALSDTTHVLKEYLGIAAYRLGIG